MLALEEGGHLIFANSGRLKMKEIKNGPQSRVGEETGLLGEAGEGGGGATSLRFKRAVKIKTSRQSTIS